MPDNRSLARGGSTAAAALALSILVAPAALGEQRHATMTVSVEVVDACRAETGESGLAGQACRSRAQPVAVLREATSSTAPGGSAPLTRLAEPGGYVTVVY
jgi:hypothetical protein